MRTITDHIVPGDSANHQIEIAVMDEPGAGGAHYEYRIAWWGPRKPKPTSDELKALLAQEQTAYQSKHPISLLPSGELSVLFQNGPIKEYGVNGVTGEALLAIQIDRLRCFQAGPFACSENEDALWHIERALELLQTRTKRRIARGVEGTHTA